MHKWSFLAGASAAVAIRAALPRLMMVKLERDLASLNAGDYRPLLAGFADDGVLYFNEGPHRWSGRHVGRAGLENFLQNFVAAGMRGEFGRLWISGPPWAMELCIRFDDAAYAPDGTQIYANRALLWARTRWGRIVAQRDFFEDTQRIIELEAKLDELSIPKK